MTYFKRLYSAQAIKHNNKSGMMVVKPDFGITHSKHGVNSSNYLG